jgi:hypothetical protein
MSVKTDTISLKRLIRDYFDDSAHVRRRRDISMM